MPDQFFADAGRWRAELLELRRILLDLGLDEALKWRQPCYLVDGRNVAILGGFKAGCRLSFFRGAELADPDGLLVAPGANTRSSRYLAFTSVDEVRQQEDRIRGFVQAATALARSDGGRGSSRRASAPPAALPGCPELDAVLARHPDMAAAFGTLTPGRRRGYLLHFTGSSRASTRISRIERCRERILAGKGLQDCVCGKSKRMPRCDGSHKHG